MPVQQTRIERPANTDYRALKPAKANVEAAREEQKPQQDVLEPQAPVNKWLTLEKVNVAVGAVIVALNAAVATQYARRAYNCPCNRQFNGILAGVHAGTAVLWTATTVLNALRIGREQRRAVRA